MIKNFPNVEDIEITDEKWLREINGVNIKKLILKNMTITNPLLLLSFVNVNIIEMWHVTIDNKIDDFITVLSSMKALSSIKIVLLNIKENNNNYTKLFQSLSNFVLLKELFIALQKNNRRRSNCIMFSIEISSFVIINYTMFNQQSKQCIFFCQIRNVKPTQSSFIHF